MKTRVFLAVMAGLLAGELLAGYPAEWFTTLSADAPVQPGAWNLGLEKCKRYCDEHNVPLFAVWGTRDCVICTQVHSALLHQSFKDFMKQGKYADVVYCIMSSGDESAEAGSIDQHKSDSWSWMRTGAEIAGTPFVSYPWSWSGKLNDWPFVAFYWKGGELDHHYQGCDEWMGVWSYPAEGAAIAIEIFEREFKDFPGATPQYAGGAFVVSGTEFDRLELNPSANSQNLVVPLVRTNNLGATYVNYLDVRRNGVVVKANQAVEWVANQTNAYPSVSIPAGLLQGDDLMVVLKDKDQLELASNRVWCAAAANSSGNPAWLGEAVAYGEWTMDLDAATNLVARQGGNTLVVITGELWCPHCKGLERQVFATEDFAKFAKDNNLALVVLDNPRRSAKDNPSTGVYSTKPDGAPPSLLRYERGVANSSNGRLASGAAYLSRHHVDLATAEKCLQRNHDLGYKAIAEGGYRPYEMGRAPYPTVLLLNSKAQIVGYVPGKSGGGLKTELVTDGPNGWEWYEDPSKKDDPTDIRGDKVSHMDVAATMCRFQDLLDLAAAGKTVYDDSAADTQAVLEVGKAETGMLNADNLIDVWRVTGSAKRARLVVKGTDAAKDGPIFVETSATAGATAGTLSIGVTNVVNVYNGLYLTVRADPTTNAPAVFSPYTTADSRRYYMVSAQEIYVPDHSEQRLEISALMEEVLLYLEAERLYVFKGIDVDRVKEEMQDTLEVVDEAEGVYRALKTVDSELPLDTTATEFIYSLAETMSVGFVRKAVTFVEGEAQAVVGVRRYDESLGEVHGYVELVEGDADQRRYELPGWFCGEELGYNTTNMVREFVFEAGSTEVKDAVVFTMKDDPVAFGEQYLVFEMHLTGSARATVEQDFGRLVSALQDNDSAQVGYLAITGAEPALSRMGQLTAVEGTQIGFAVSRLGGSTGSKAATMVLEYAGVAITNAPQWWLDCDMDNERVFVFTLPKLSQASSAVATLVSDVKDPIAVLPEQSSVNITIVSSEAPQASGDVKVVAVRDVEFSNAIDFSCAGGADGYSVRLVSGALPPGVSGEVTGSSLVVNGRPSRCGDYSAKYILYAEKAGSILRGGSFAVDIQVVDVAQAAAEPSLEVPLLSRELVAEGVPVFGNERRYLVGVLNLSVPVSGRASAKLVTESGSYAYVSTGWSSAGDKALVNRLVSSAAARKFGNSGLLKVIIKGDDQADAELEIEGGDIVALSDLCNTALKSTEGVVDTGVYTVAMPMSETLAGRCYRCAGDTFLSLSVAEDGQVKYAGVLPDGRSVSGMARLRREYDSEERRVLALLPFARYASGLYGFGYSGVLKIFPGAAKGLNPTLEKYDQDNWWTVRGMQRGVPHWSPVECKCGAEFSVYGSFFDAKLQEGWLGRSDYGMGDIAGFGYGPLGAYWISEVSFENDTVAVLGDNPQNIRLAYDSRTGVVSGTFIHPNTQSRASFCGVMLPGWKSSNKASGCTMCGEDVYAHPMTGACWYDVTDPEDGHTYTEGTSVWMDCPFGEGEEE